MNCIEFEGLLEGVLDGTLDDHDRSRCVRHAATCCACGELVEPMGRELVPVSCVPPPSLLNAVLNRTTRSRRNRWAETWRQWMLRPRFASEAAYVGVVVLSLAATRLDPNVVIGGVCSEARILLDHATSLWEKEKP